MNDEEKNLISELCQNGLAPYQVMYELRDKFKPFFVYGDVYNIQTNSVPYLFQKHTYLIALWNNTIKKVVQLVFNAVNSISQAQALSRFWRENLTQCQIQEVLIDSLFNKSQQKLQLYVLISFLMGVWFRIANFC